VAAQLNMEKSFIIFMQYSEFTLYAQCIEQNQPAIGQIAIL
jgi:hypothetical protein